MASRAAADALKEINTIAPESYYALQCELYLLSANISLRPKDRGLVSKMVALCRKLEKVAPTELKQRAAKRTKLWAGHEALMARGGR